nr:hypothetical protein HK105_007590 [Polyrhizophydium stewartii]
MTATTYTRDGVQFIFHQACFTCEMCATSIDGKQFYLSEGKHLCTDCYHDKVLGRCDTCGQPFVSSAIIKAGGKQFHPPVRALVIPRESAFIHRVAVAQCFSCSLCHKQLRDTYIEKNDKFMCRECYESAFLPLCSTCGTRILPAEGTGTIVAVEWKDKKYHQDCFACKVCGKPFDDLKAVAHNDSLYCRECFEDEATQNAV